MASLIASVRSRIEDRSRYLKTLAELRMLSDNDMSDLGFTRYDIRKIAHDAVYGEQAAH
ncbi:MAG: DUF1127 domain-containing protein [Pseudomonadota bacterium]